MNIQNLRDVYHEQLKDMYSAENQLTEALPKMLEAASSPELKQAIQEHLDITRTQLQRVSSLLQSYSINPGSKKCKAMEGLIEEANEMAKKQGDNDARDAGLICAAQKVEHYEIATYGTLKSWAMSLGEHEATDILQGLLDEEYEANNMLTSIAESYLNEEANS